MNKQEIQNKINELKSQVAELEEELNKPESKVFKPEDGDAYYCINAGGRSCSSIWRNDIFDSSRYAIGNCFATREEAEFKAERLKVIAELERFADEHNEPIDWNVADHKEKCFIYYDCFRKALEIDFRYITKYNDIYFSSEEIAKQAIAKVGEDRIKKYYLQVE